MPQQPHITSCPCVRACVHWGRRAVAGSRVRAELRLLSARAVWGDDSTACTVVGSLGVGPSGALQLRCAGTERREERGDDDGGGNPGLALEFVVGVLAVPHGFGDVWDGMARVRRGGGGSVGGGNDTAVLIADGYRGSDGDASPEGAAELFVEWHGVRSEVCVRHGTVASGDVWAAHTTSTACTMDVLSVSRQERVCQGGSGPRLCR